MRLLVTTHFQKTRRNSHSANRAPGARSESETTIVSSGSHAFHCSHLRRRRHRKRERETRSGEERHAGAPETRVLGRAFLGLRARIMAIDFSPPWRGLARVHHEDDGPEHRDCTSAPKKSTQGSGKRVPRGRVACVLAHFRRKTRARPVRRSRLVHSLRRRSSRISSIVGCICGCLFGRLF